MKNSPHQILCEAFAQAKAAIAGLALMHRCIGNSSGTNEMAHKSNRNEEENETDGDEKRSVEDTLAISCTDTINLRPFVRSLAMLSMFITISTSIPQHAMALSWSSSIFAFASLPRCRCRSVAAFVLILFIQLFVLFHIFRFISLPLFLCISWYNFLLTKSQTLLLLFKLAYFLRRYVLFEQHRNLNLFVSMHIHNPLYSLFNVHIMKFVFLMWVCVICCCCCVFCFVSCFFPLVSFHFVSLGSSYTVHITLAIVVSKYTPFFPSTHSFIRLISFIFNKTYFK